MSKITAEDVARHFAPMPAMFSCELPGAAALVRALEKVRVAAVNHLHADLSVTGEYLRAALAEVERIEKGEKP